MSKVLIVEDEAPLREAFEFLLGSEGFDVLCAENGRIALSVLKGFEPDVILLDMLMPEINGLEFLQKAKLTKAYPKTKVIVLSNLTDSLTMQDAKTYGVDQTVLKANLSPADLVAIVKDSLADVYTNEPDR